MIQFLVTAKCSEKNWRGSDMADDKFATFLVRKWTILRLEVGFKDLLTKLRREIANVWEFLDDYTRSGVALDLLANDLVWQLLVVDVRNRVDLQNGHLALELINLFACHERGRA